jgi:hypothetical protein
MYFKFAVATADSQVGVLPRLKDLTIAVDHIVPVNADVRHIIWMQGIV